MVAAQGPEKMLTNQFTDAHCLCEPRGAGYNRGAQRAKLTAPPPAVGFRYRNCKSCWVLGAAAEARRTSGASGGSWLIMLAVRAGAGLCEGVPPQCASVLGWRMGGIPAAAMHAGVALLWRAAAAVTSVAVAFPQGPRPPLLQAPAWLRLTAGRCNTERPGRHRLNAAGGGRARGSYGQQRWGVRWQRNRSGRALITAVGATSGRDAEGSSGH